MLIDSHCHIDFPELAQELPALLSAMAARGVIGALCVGVSLEDFPRILNIVRETPNILATLGVHPEAAEVHSPTVETLVRLGQAPEVLAIGETGLDYYWHKDKPRWQQERFRTHIHAARQLKKPLIIHNRDASDDVLSLLREEGAQDCGGIFHCFTESAEIAFKAIDLGFYISFSGIVSFKNAALVREAAQRIPLDRLLVETDSPFLAPHPYRGKQNQPAYVYHVAEAVAALREIPLAEVESASTENFFRLFPFAKTRMCP